MHIMYVLDINSCNLSLLTWYIPPLPREVKLTRILPTVPSPCTTIRPPMLRYWSYLNIRTHTANLTGKTVGCRAVAIN